jgi:hypothetical protein
VCLVAILCAWTSFVQTQSSTGTSLSGVVADVGGGVIPGANVVVKNNGTAETFETVTNSSGAFSVPSLPAGTYTVTVSLAGFKTAVITDVRLVTGNPGNIKAALEVGALTETVEVKGGSELIQTQSTAVTSTLKVEQIKELPLVSRNTLYVAQFLPGVETTSGPRGSLFSGLPNNTVNVSIDGITTGNSLQSTDGFFSMVTPRLDAVEEVTVTGATPGTTGGTGAVQIAFVTRSGSNNFDSSIYHYFRHPSLNTNYYFNEIDGLDKNNVKVHQYGGRVGGPIIIPGLFNGRNKAFFFFNFEHEHRPSEATRTRTILNQQAMQGIFTYTVGGVNRQINLLALAAANGQTATLDPTIANLLTSIRESTGVTGAVTTPQGATNTQDFRYQSGSTSDQYAPTTRIDFNVTDAHRLTGTYYWQRFLSKPDLLNNADPSFPGFPNQGFQTSYRTTGSVALRSTLSSNIVNEVKTGWQWSPNNFFGNITADMFDNQGGYSMTLAGAPLNLTNATAGNFGNAPAPRNTVNWSVENTVNWLRGNHSVSFGGIFQQLVHEQNTASAVPGMTFGVDANNDPAASLFNTTNFQGASTTQLNEARAMYALLTGRVASITANARLNDAATEYVYNGNLFQKSKLSAFSFYGQDSWRLTPALTMNLGLRWELQLPFTPVTNNWTTATMADLCGMSGVGSGPGGRGCNLFQPGTIPSPGFVPQYTLFSPGSTAYDTDWDNVAPNVGLAWRPNVQNGWLRTLLGDPEQATVRAGYTMSYSLERMDRFTGLYGNNPGPQLAASRNYTTGFPMLGPGESAPVLLRETSRLGAPAFQTTPAFPLSAVAANNVNIFEDGIEVPYVHSWTVGLQRSLGPDTAIEVRYVGNRNMNAWTTENWNQDIIFENGFFNEFRQAQANLAANVAAGRGGTFAYTGAPGTAPLPIYLAYFQGLSSGSAGNPASYTSTNFTNSAWTGHLGYYEPDPADAVNDLHNNTTFRANAVRAGLPANFINMNPAITNASITRALAGTRYNSLQIELRRRLTHGLLVNANYTYARKYESSLQTLTADRIYLDGTDVPHSFKMNWLYEIPVGHGRRFGSDINPILNGIIGDWQFSGTGRFQTQMFAISDAKLVGMSHDELQDAFQIREVRANDGTITVFSFPQDIIDNTRRAYNTDPTSVTGYSADGAPTGRYIAPASDPNCVAIYVGDCGAPRQIKLNGPLFTRFDIRFQKRFPLKGKANIEIDFELLNVFDNINFNHQFNPGGAVDAFQVETAYTDINTTFDPGGRIGQLVWRINF